MHFLSVGSSTRTLYVFLNSSSPSAGGVGWLRPLLFKEKEMPLLPNAVGCWLTRGQFETSLLLGR